MKDTGEMAFYLQYSAFVSNVLAMWLGKESDMKMTSQMLCEGIWGIVTEPYYMWSKSSSEIWNERFLKIGKFNKRPFIKWR